VKKMSTKIYPVGKEIKSKFYCYTKAKCSECGEMHWYRKYGSLKERFDGRIFTYMCFQNNPNPGLKIIGTKITKTLKEGEKE